MNKEDWENLERLGVLEADGKLSPIGRDNYFTLLHKTERVDEHPEEYNGPCLCRLCMSYADNGDC